MKCLSFLLFEGFYSSTPLFYTFFFVSFSHFTFANLLNNYSGFYGIIKNTPLLAYFFLFLYFFFPMIFHSMIIIFTLHTYMMRFLIFILHICYFYVMMRSCHYELLSGVMKIIISQRESIKHKEIIFAYLKKSKNKIFFVSLFYCHCQTIVYFKMTFFLEAIENL